jgi:hypothetical protein
LLDDAKGAFNGLKGTVKKITEDDPQLYMMLADGGFNLCQYFPEKCHCLHPIRYMM